MDFFNYKYFKGKLPKGKPLLLFVLIFLVGINSILADNYYWVGGSGNWSDINHWATSSGGSVLHSQTPTPVDDVFFDANSFSTAGQIITINQKNAVCNSLDWSGVLNNPTLTGHDTTNLRIYGNLNFSSSMSQNYLGEVIFESVTSGKEITTNGNSFNNTVRFLGIGGGWKLLDDFSVNGSIYFVNGKLETNGVNLNCDSFFSLEGNSREILLANSILTLGSWQIDGQNLNLQALAAQFFVGSLFSNNNGNPLFYSNIRFTGLTGSVINSNVYVTYNNINFDFDGSIAGDCSINTVTTVGNGLITDNDSINLVVFDNGGSIIGGEHVIGTFIGNNTSSIEGDNKIGTALFHKESRVTGNNTIDSVYFFDEGQILKNNQIRELIISNFGKVSGSNNIENALLLNDGYISGNNSFGVLTFSPGNTYTFAIESVQSIENEWNISGDCYKPIRMLSDTNGVQATIDCNFPVNGEYLSIRDLKASGSTPFDASNSVDLGNNTNWNIGTSGGLNLYWVNGAGNWDDPTHWDENSGGIGGHCPPTEIDNANFDANSFSSSGVTITVNIKNAVCRDMLWENVNSPVFMGADTTNLRIYGSLTLSPQMQWLFLGQTFFEAIEKGKTITTATKVFNNHCWFNGRGGSWRLMDDFKTFQKILHQQGEVYTSGNNIDCFLFSSTDTTTRKLCLSTSTVTMTAPFLKVWDLCAENLELCADSSLLISTSPGGTMISFSGVPPLIYNNVEFYGFSSQLVNSVYCNYNLVTFFDSLSMVKKDCTIDTLTFHSTHGEVRDSDTIKTAIFYGKGGYFKNSVHVVEIAYFFDDGKIEGINKVDTTLFYRNATIIGNNEIDTCIVFNKAFIDGNNQIRTATLLGDGNLSGENTFNDLTFTKSRSYYFESEKTQTVHDNLNREGSCTGPIILQSDKNQTQAVLAKTNGSVDANYLTLRDIKGEGNGTPFIAYNSVDLGNNTNWTINTSSPKELYWVGGNGVWSDSLHWSGVSGGTGGYCIPSPIDNVYFDQNSFIQNNDTVFIDIGNANCHNMSWEGASLKPVFSSPDTNNLSIFGSLLLNSNMSLRIHGPTFFESTHDDNSIECKANVFPMSVYFQGIGGQWTLNDDFQTDSTLIFSNGEIITSGNSVECWAFNSDFTNNRSFIFTESTITLNGSGIEAWFVNGVNFSMEAENSLIKLNGNSAIVRTDFGGPLVYGDLLAESDQCWIYNRNTNLSFRKAEFLKSGQIHGNCSIDSVLFGGSGSIFDSDVIEYLRVDGELGNIDGQHSIMFAEFANTSDISGNNSFDTVLIAGRSLLSGTNTINNYLQVGSLASISGSNFVEEAVLSGDGNFNGTNTFNSLTFTPGNTYQLEEGITQFVNNQFNIRGNNCFPITLRSQNDGVQADISIPSGVIVSGDFIEIRDINASGGADFYAGKFSTDVSNNDGWLFNNSPGYIFGFPSDTTLCFGHNLTIGTENFNPDEQSTFLWQDGSTLPYFNVTTEDSLWVTVQYAFDCSFTDTILINRSPSPELDLGPDRTMCQGDSIFIVNASDSLTYLWSDGSTDTVFLATESGTVSLTVTSANGCFTSDSIEIIAKPTPIVFLGNDTTLRWDETIVLDAENYGSTYYWSTGDTVQSITVAGSEQLVWVVVDYNGCSGNDTIMLNEFPRCILAVPNAFSPNGDGQNDVLYVRGSGFSEFEFLVFNRMGEQVFNTSNESVGWDGTYRGKPQEVDVFMYILKGKCADGQDVFKKGNISLLR